MATLLQRDTYECYTRNGVQYCNRNAWDNWVRWLVAVLIIIGFFLLFVVCSCITARRRRKAGRQPYYGTGWMARPGQGGLYNNQQSAQPYYNNQYAQPAPPYSPQPQQQGSYYGNGTNQGYYNNAANPYGQQQGVELQSPRAAHHPGSDTYAPPPGPPPAKV